MLLTEICDYVNAKQGSTPREAAIAVVKLISQKGSTNARVGTSALLDNCVKIAVIRSSFRSLAKEFLNELVRRFPERPPASVYSSATNDLGTN